MYKIFLRFVPINIILPHSVELATLVWVIFESDNVQSKQSSGKLKLAVVFTFFIDAIISLLLNAYVVQKYIHDYLLSHLINGVISVPIAVCFLQIFRNKGIFDSKKGVE